MYWRYCLRNWSFRGIDERCPVAIDKQVEVPRDASANTIKEERKEQVVMLILEYDAWYSFRVE